MKHFTWLEERGAAVALMTDEADGDCGWEGCASGSRGAYLNQAPIPAEKLVVLRQCHGAAVFVVEREDAGRGAVARESALGDGDGLMTRHKGIPLGINIADCVPVFLCGDGVVAVVHAGRVGTELKIASRAVEQIGETYGVAPESLFGFIGPSAGPCCYQVGPEIRQTSTSNGVIARGDCLDLWESNRVQLRDSGLPDAHIMLDSVCTICQPGYFSYRARGTAERNLAIIMG